mgnify:FL=1
MYIFFQMNLCKKFKKSNNHNNNIDNDDDDDDDIIILDSKTSSNLNEFCQHIEKTTNAQTCREFNSVVCTHCQLSLCYIHAEMHRILLVNERDQLINELNERIDELNQLIDHPEKIEQILIEKYQLKIQQKISFPQQIGLSKSFDLIQLINELKQLFQPIRNLCQQNQSVSIHLIKRIKQSFRQFDENKKLLFNKIINSLSIIDNQSIHYFHLSTIEFPCRKYELPVQQSNCNQMAASDNLLIVNDREHLLLFNLINSFDENLIPELISWKTNIDGRILDLQYSFYLKVFFVLTDEKLFLFDRLSSSLNCLHRFTSHPWSCMTRQNSIYILYKYSTVIEQWTLDNLSSFQLTKQWQFDEISTECEHDQHLRCIRTNPSQTLIGILIENDECRWRIALFDTNMRCLHQTDILPDASTIDWNLIFSFLSDQQIVILDATKENIYSIQFNENHSSIEYKNCSNSDYPVNACVINSNGHSQLILKMVRPNMLKFFQL